MRKPMSLRLRVTLLCAALLTLCCLLLTVTNNFSAIRMADAIQAVPLLPAQRAELEDSVSLPMAELHISDTIQQAQGAFHMQSLLAMVAILALGLFLIYRLVGKPLLRWTHSLAGSGSGRLRIWRSPLRSPTAGMRRPQWPWRSIRCPSG